MKKIAELLDKLTPAEGFTIPQGVNGVKLFSISEQAKIQCKHVIYDCGIVIIAQGEKIGYLGDETLYYNKDNYLVISSPMPMYCETINSKENPLLGMFIDVDLKILNELVSLIDMPFEFDSNDLRGAQSLPYDDDILKSIERFLEVLQNPQDSKVLANSLLREIIYYILKGGKADSLYAVTERNTNFSRIARVIRSIQDNYSNIKTIDEMAKDAQMSVSSFHREFKKVTAESAIQYLKKYRLTKAKDLIVQDKLNANIAAKNVGYDSISQFSREFKRMFGEPPSYFIKN